ncbi:MAG: nitroreductase family deazaflavin-dependent oxidoreductase [Anaerolineae bacterium]|nr:nitroreductase family deazaflavin-dependent oxidoreductase [Anaerolineae bacterium]
MGNSLMENEALTRQMFRQLNRFMLLMWRLGMGPLLQHPFYGYIMVLITTGHKSGQQRKAPINYDRQGDTVYILPGFGKKTHWYRNLKADPNCELWLPDGWWRGIAEEVTDPDEHLSALRRVLTRAGVVTNLVEGKSVAEMSDDDLRAMLDRYPVSLRIRLLKQLSGPGGPGDLAWVWAVVGLIALLMLLRPRRKR